ncbi:hypothetical protein KORDIASMS9_01468 [Kordia sp. SMS9]|uniref:hypothetical protein n=1 Tax=Kordia sp. SMS9 TaxID=2282170 RepID=UPI000E0D07F3|nr:hypothetical protein [Kordia sp. SMS9]AXG69248.1 hypothetical protein KORDIASMS9_01468 [Kordia sp. SMS9]
MTTQQQKNSAKNSQKIAVAHTAESVKSQHDGISLKDNRIQAVSQRKIISFMQTSNPIQRVASDVIQLFSTPSVLRFAENKIGRSKNAGIVDESAELGTGLKFIQHFHCNGWKEQAKTFTSFTGTFNIGGTKYHYTIKDGGAGAWTKDPGKPPEGSFAMQMRTENKLSKLTKAD